MTSDLAECDFNCNHVALNIFKIHEIFERNSYTNSRNKHFSHLLRFFFFFKFKNQLCIFAAFVERTQIVPKSLISEIIQRNK